MNLIYDKYGNKIKYYLEKNNSISIGSNSSSGKYGYTKEKWIPKTIYSKEILIKTVFKKYNSSNTVSITGHLHHGKSTFLNLLASSVHLINDKFLMDTFSNLSFIEQDRHLTLYPNIITLMLYSKQKKSKIFNLIDCPGHPDFQDQVVTCMEVSDGVVLLLDLAEGVMIGSELSLKNSITRGLPLVVVLNGLDRLVIELNLSINETHLKIITVIDELNMIIQKILGISGFKTKKQFKYFNPILNNVCFSSLIQGWTFTLGQFSEIYLSSQPSCCLSVIDLSFFLWNCTTFFNYEKDVPPNFLCNMSFLFQDLVLYPLFKLIFFNLTENYLHIRKLIETELGIYGIRLKEFSFSSEKVCNLCISLFLGGCRDVKLVYNHSGIIASLSYHISSNRKTANLTSINEKNLNINSKTGLIINSFFQKNSNKTVSLCKILNGKIKTMDKVRVVTSEAYFYKNQRYFSVCQIKSIIISIARYTIKIRTGQKGMIVFINGFEFNTKENGFFFNLGYSDLFLDFSYSATKRFLINCKIGKVVKVLIKTVQAINLEFFFKALRICSKIYPNLSCQMKSNGNIILSSTSELYLNCVLQDIKEILGEIDFISSDAYLPFKETLLDDTEIHVNFFNNNLLMNIKKSMFLSKNNFSMVGFLGIYKNLYLNFGKNDYILNSVSGGYLSNKIKEKQKINKLKSNSIWFFDFDTIETGKSFLRGNSVLNFSKGKKKSILLEVKRLLKKGSLLAESLYGIELTVEEKESFFNKFESIFLIENMKSMENVLFNSKTVTSEPIFLGEIIFPHNYFSMILRYLRIKLTLISSFDDYLGGGYTIIRFQMPGSMLVGFDRELALLTQGKGFCFFIFDSWKNNN